jgi:hypothetical protein
MGHPKCLGSRKALSHNMVASIHSKEQMALVALLTIGFQGACKFRHKSVFFDS